MGDIIIQGDRHEGELEQPDDFYLARIAALESRLSALEGRHAAHEQIDSAAHVEISAQAEEAQEIAEEAQELAAESALMATLATIEQTTPEEVIPDDGNEIQPIDAGTEEEEDGSSEEIPGEETEPEPDGEPEPVILSIEPERKPESEQRKSYRFARGRRR